MGMRLHGRRLGLLAAALLTIQWSLTAQTPRATSASAKRPISYDVVDSWRSIQATRLSQDGQWLAYALTHKETMASSLSVILATDRNSRRQEVRIHRSPPMAGSSSSPSRKRRRTKNGSGRRTGATLVRGAGLRGAVTEAAATARRREHRARAWGSWRFPVDRSPRSSVSAASASPTSRRHGGPVTKADKADAVVFTLSRFEEFPNLWISDTSFRNMQKVSDANPQQSEFVWGKSEIIEYINADGKTLRAILTKPDNFDPAKKYPLMVHIYEELTNNLHSYSTPNVATSINITRYVSNGYVMLRPDITYATGYPGESAEKCVIPAVNTVLAMGFIDPKRIGIQGHSWGGYQVTHLITRTNLFAAVEAGASVSNMISAYGGIRWGTGMVREFQYEKSQSRIGAPPWDAPLQYIENSPIFWVKKIQTPYLTIHNDADDAVPWYQGIEFNTAMRRLGKEAYMFTYNGEPHGLRNRDNMKHWTVHMDEFFDHYLFGKPRPEWMDKGVTYLDRGKRDVAPMFKKKTAATSTSTQDR